MRVEWLWLVLISVGLAGAGCAAGPGGGAGGEDEAYDVVVYGAAPGGVAAAVNAGREGMRVALFQEDGHVGGLASGGLSNPDFRSFEMLGGTYRAFMQRVVAHYADTYGPDSQQVIDSVEGGYPEPRVARMVFEQMLDEAGVQVYLHHRLTDVQVSEQDDGEGRRIERVQLRDRQRNRTVDAEATVFIDGTYEGDLMAAAGVPYQVGREAADQYDEELAPEEADEFVQAYNFRVVLTTDDDNVMPIPRPDGYDREPYTPLLDWIEQQEVDDVDSISRYIARIRRMPNRKAEFNDVRTAPMSMSRSDINHAWPDGDAETRQEIFQQYKDWSLGFFYFLQHDEAVPESVRQEMQRWNLPRDEFVDTDYWTPALYIREARRMIGQRVFTEHDTGIEPGSVRSVLQPDAVAISDYSINTHGVHSPEPGERIGVIGRSVRPLQIPYGIIVPKRTQNLLVPVAVSASHVGFAALRYEPAWTALGQAAGLAAAQAVQRESAVQDVDVADLQWRLHELGALTLYVSDLGERTDVPRPRWDRPDTTFPAWLHSVPPESELFRPVQWFGTQGFLHVLVDPDEADSWRADRATGQWRQRIPNHELKPDEVVDEELGQQWLDLAERMDFDPGMAVSEIVEAEMTRGEVLKRLFQAYEQQR